MTTVPISILRIGERTIIEYTFSGLSFLLGFTSMALTKDFGLILIGTEAVSGPLSLIKHRIQDQPELLYMYVEPEPKLLVRPKLTQSYECSLPEQRIGNSRCTRENKIIEIINNYKSDDVIIDQIIDYDEVVNMEIITGLTNPDFSNQFELVSTRNPAPIKKLKSETKPRSRTVNLLDKFGDPENIPDSQT